MQGFLVLLVVGIVFGPIVLSIIALSTASRASREVRELKARLAGEPIKSAPMPAPVVVAPAPPPPVSHPAVQPVAAPQPPPRPVVPVPTKAERDGKMEVAIGGKVASFIGIASLVISVVFFVGYAIQHNWIGPGLRILLGLMAGGGLVAIGHVAEVRNKNLRVLARALTGGGSALFYFCVFAAYNIYHLIGPSQAGAGLVASAAAVLALSAVYDSQVIAVLGLLGAYVTPVLISGDFSSGIFPLAYIAIVNIPVIAIGVRRHWSVLQSLATLFTTVLAAVWLSRELGGADEAAWKIGLGFVLIYYCEFVVLGLLKIGSKRSRTVQAFDIMRVLFASLALLGALEWILIQADHRDWRGPAYLLIAIAHVGVVQVGRRKCRDFKEEILAFTVVALTFASLALPAQLDGVWVSLGWGFEGVLLAWFALKVDSPLLQLGAVGLGLLGLGKSMLYDVTLYDARPQLFWNGRFFVGLISALLLGAQGSIHARLGRALSPKAPDADGSASRPYPSWADPLWCIAVLALVVVFFSDTFFTMNASDPWAWMITTLALFGVGIFATLSTSGGKPVAAVGLLMLIAVPFKVCVLDIGMGWSGYWNDYDAFHNSLFLLRLLVVGMTVSCIVRQDTRGALVKTKGVNLPLFMYIVCMVSVLWLVTVEIRHMRSTWSGPLITIWWAVSAFAMVIAGLKRRRTYLRYMGLIVFAAAVLKVFLVDTSDLNGLERIAAFFGVGMLLLFLSYIYQRIAPVLMGKAGGDAV